MSIFKEISINFHYIMESLKLIFTFIIKITKLNIFVE
jgi:hypothetical protein